MELFKAWLVTYGDPQLAQWPPPDAASARHLATVPMPGEGRLGTNCVYRPLGHTRMGAGRGCDDRMIVTRKWCGSVWVATGPRYPGTGDIQ